MRRGTVGGLLLLVAAATGCGPTHATTTVVPTASIGTGTPLQVTEAWFAAVNAKQRAAVRAFFVPADLGRDSWTDADPRDWSTFTSLACAQTAEAATTATVHCTFVESDSPTEGNPDTFWDVELERQTDGRWLVADYGQG